MKQKELETKNIVLRRAKLNDAEKIYKYQQDKDTKRNFMSIPKSIAGVKKDIIKSKKNKTKDSFVIEYQGELVGEINIHDIIKGHKAISSSWIARRFRGKRIGTQAHKMLLKYAFRKYKLKRIQGNVRTFNKASARMLEKAGYKLEGILRKNKLKDRKFIDDMVYAVVK